jgi:biofilm PGA synthesis N-glycosyltransferase PgaC
MLGFVAFVLTYQMLMSPVSVAGYVQELFGLRRRWK